MNIMRWMTLCLLFFPACVYPKYISNVREYRAADLRLEQFGREMAAANNIQFLELTEGTLLNTMSVFGIHYVDDKKVTIEEARPLVIHLAKKHWKEIITQKAYRNYFSYQQRKFGSSYYPKITYVGFQIAYWDENVDRPLPPYLARIQVSNGEARYYYADPKTQALQEPIVEKLDELVELVLCPSK